MVVKIPDRLRVTVARHKSTASIQTTRCSICSAASLHKLTKSASENLTQVATETQLHCEEFTFQSTVD